MNVKETAKFLINKFRNHAYSGRDEDKQWRTEHAKQCALITIDFVIEKIRKDGEYSAVSEINWYNIVKDEIVIYEPQS